MSNRVRHIGSAVTRRWFTATAIGAATHMTTRFASAADELEQLYAAAKEEAALSYYAGGPVGPHQQTVAEFQKEFPGIKIDLKTGFSNQLTAPIDAQLGGGRLEADIANLQTFQDVARWKRQGSLMPNRGPNFDQVEDQFKSSDGTSVGIRVYALGYGYNPDLVAKESVPKSALGFLDPKFSGKIVSTYPHDDDVTLYLYGTIVQAHGWDFMRRFMENRPQFIRGHVGVVREIIAGRAALSFDCSVGTVSATRQGGGRIEIAFPAEDPMPIWENRCCIFKNAPHPNAARLFEAWLLSYKFQSQQGVWSTRRDVAPVGGLQPISSYRTANRFGEFIQDEKRVAELRRRFEAYIGPVRGEPVLSLAPMKG
jgi:ABC-type Fe3+ transport system substrate-binding protein